MRTQFLTVQCPRLSSRQRYSENYSESALRPFSINTASATTSTIIVLTYYLPANKELRAIKRAMLRINAERVWIKQTVERLFVVCPTA